MPMTDVSELDRLLAVLGGINAQNLRSEIEKAEAVRRWAMKQADIDYEPGEKVMLVEPSEIHNHGWKPYKDALADGATATVQNIDFNRVYDYWYAEIILDREFAWNEYLGRHNWHGLADETPDGMEPPSKYEQENYPQGRRHTFCVPVRFLRRIDD